MLSCKQFIISTIDYDWLQVFESVPSHQHKKWPNPLPFLSLAFTLMIYSNAFKSPTPKRSMTWYLKIMMQRPCNILSVVVVQSALLLGPFTTFFIVNKCGVSSFPSKVFTKTYNLIVSKSVLPSATFNLRDQFSFFLSTHPNLCLPGRHLMMWLIFAQEHFILLRNCSIREHLPENGACVFSNIHSNVVFHYELKKT